jgi:hypothetical protein
MELIRRCTEAASSASVAGSDGRPLLAAHEATHRTISLDWEVMGPASCRPSWCGQWSASRTAPSKACTVFLGWSWPPTSTFPSCTRAAPPAVARRGRSCGLGPLPGPRLGSLRRSSAAAAGEGARVGSMGTRQSRRDNVEVVQLGVLALVASVGLRTVRRNGRRPRQPGCVPWSTRIPHFAPTAPPPMTKSRPALCGRGTRACHGRR